MRARTMGRSSEAFFFILIILFSFTSLADPICVENSENSALIVVDMQSNFVSRRKTDKIAENRLKYEQLIKEQIAAIERAKAVNIPIVFLEYEGPHGDTVEPLTAATDNYTYRKVFKKSSDGMFEEKNKYKKELVHYLQKKKVGTLIMMGANGGDCVLHSITGGLGGGCAVITYSKGIVDFNSKNFIYPYESRYANVANNCKDCPLKEVSSIDEVAKFMINTPNRPSPPLRIESRSVR